MMNPYKKKQAPVLSSQPLTIDLDRLLYEVVTPQEFIDIYEVTPEAIKTADVVPAQLGKSGFGSIRIQWKHPVYGEKCPGQD